jgi:hypothetical protein
MMPRPHDDGDCYYIPVEVAAASRTADETRARNAGASARHRERRRGREREVHGAVQRLEHQLRALDAQRRDADARAARYRRERDAYRDLVRSTPAIAHLARAPSAAVGAQSLASDSLGGVCDGAGGEA